MVCALKLLIVVEMNGMWCLSPLERESEGTSSQNDEWGKRFEIERHTLRESRKNARDDGNRVEQQRATFTTRELYQHEQQDDEETIFAPRFFFFERRRRFRER
jgi:hypothetical protein